MKTPLVLLLLALPSLPAQAETAPAGHGAPVDSSVIIPPAWAFGVLYGGYTNQEQTIRRIEAIKAHDYPIDAYWIDSWFWSFNDSGRGPHKYIDFVADTDAFPDRRAMWDYMQRNNVKGGFWVWNCILKTGNEQAFEDFQSRGHFSDVYLNKNGWHNSSASTAMFQDSGGHPGTLCGNIDFGNPEAVAHFKSRMKHFFDEGADFIKLDRTSAVNVCKAMFEMTAEYGLETGGRGFILSHTGGTKDNSYKRYPAKWTDDTRSDWNIQSPRKEFDVWVPEVAFQENIAMYTDPTNDTSGIPFLTNDLGGFDLGKSHELDEELYIRWLQFSMLCPITEVFSQPENPTSNLAWLYSERADALFRQYSHVRMQLFPYLYSYAHLTRITGQNMVRPLEGHLYEYLLGNEILVAPVYEKGAATRTLSLPPGAWTHFWSGQSLEGGKEHTVEAPLEQIPLFLRAGSIVPLRHYAPSIEGGTNDSLILNVYPGADGTFRLVEDDGTSNEYLDGRYAVTDIELQDSGDRLKITIHPVAGRFSQMQPWRNWALHIQTAREASEVRGNLDNLTHQQEEKLLVIEGRQPDKHEPVHIEVRLK